MAKVYKEAEEKNLEGDEEKAYIYYMRFFNLLNIVKKTPDFSIQKEQITSLLGGSKGLTRTLDQLENIAANLRHRYIQAFPELDHVTIDDEESDYTRSETPPKPVVEVPTTVSPKQLYEYIKDCSFSLLIIDCRPTWDYAATKIKYESLMNVPEEILVKGVSAGKIASYLKEEKHKWALRLIKSHIVLLDQSSCEFGRDSPVWVLNDVLKNWDVDISKQTPVQLLAGGFETFQLYYPTEVTDSRYKPAPQSSDDYEDFEDIRYPDSVFNSTFTINKTSPGGPSRPKINRESKAVAVQTYAEKEKQYNELQERRKKNLNDSIEIGRQRVEAEANWAAIEEKGFAPNESHETSQEVYHKILELESKARDIQVEDERLEEKEKTFLEMLPEAEATKLQEHARQQEEEKEAKEKERKKREYQAEQKRLAEERERKLKETRVVKQYVPKATPPPPPQKPQQPFIPDRSAKPHFKPFFVPERKRDFSPVGSGSVSLIFFIALFLLHNCSY